MNKPKIGIAGNILVNESGMFPGMYRSYVNHNYVTSIAKAGGVPIILPVIDKEEDIRMQIQGLDGILLTGGYDVDPSLYGEDISPECGEIMPEVDHFYLHLIHIADEMHIPLFGICKGIQILNVAFGGTIYQEQANFIPHCLKHVQSAPRYEGTHLITTEDGSFVQKAIGKSIRVNSFHHQSIHQVASGFSVTAKANDGIIEAIERKEGSFMAAVQFHPEMMAEYDDPMMIGLFHAFITICENEEKQ